MRHPRGQGKRAPKVGEIVHYVVDYPDKPESWGGHGCRPALVIASSGMACNLQIFLDAADKFNSVADPNELYANPWERFIRYECMNTHERYYLAEQPWKWASELWDRPCPHRPWHWHFKEDCRCG